MPRIDDELLTEIRAAVEDGGAEYLGIRGDSVLFRDPQSGEICSLFLFAATRTNIRLALKGAREKTFEFVPWT